VNYTIRKTPLARRGRANVQVMASTRDELKHLAQEHGISIGAMVERLVGSWAASCHRERQIAIDKRMVI
jgi:hypothetical protein